ncbi:MAG: HNH endonuclease [Cyanobacteria bacterium J06639_14]
MSTVPEVIRARVRQRAGNRCEYCLSPQALVMGRLQSDHVFPIAKGGSDSEENLCLACELCNQYKWTKTEAGDPETKTIVPLFNPRN